MRKPTSLCVQHHGVRASIAASMDCATILSCSTRTSGRGAVPWPRVTMPRECGSDSRSICSNTTELDRHYRDLGSGGSVPHPIQSLCLLREAGVHGTQGRGTRERCRKSTVWDPPLRSGYGWQYECSVHCTHVATWTMTPTRQCAMWLACNTRDYRANGRMDGIEEAWMDVPLEQGVGLPEDVILRQRVV